MVRSASKSTPLTKLKLAFVHIARQFCPCLTPLAIFGSRSYHFRQCWRAVDANC